MYLFDLKNLNAEDLEMLIMIGGFLLIIFGCIFYMMFFFGTQVVARVIDGDGFETTNGTIYRTAENDAPELSQVPAGQRSKRYLEKMIQGKRIRIRPVRYKKGKKAGQQKYCVKGRPLCKIYSYWWRIDIIKRMVKSGNAVAEYGNSYQKYEVDVPYERPKVFRQRSKKNEKSFKIMFA